MKLYRNEKNLRLNVLIRKFLCKKYECINRLLGLDKIKQLYLCFYFLLNVTMEIALYVTRRKKVTFYQLRLLCHRLCKGLTLGVKGLSM